MRLPVHSKPTFVIKVTFSLGQEDVQLLTTGTSQVSLTGLETDVLSNTHSAQLVWTCDNLQQGNQGKT